MKNLSYFEKEEHAAYRYDILALEHFGKNAKINGIDRPDDFVEVVKNIIVPRNLHECVSLSRDKKDI